MAKEHVFKLSAPLKTHDGEVRELKLKEPKASLLMNCDKDPFRMKLEGDGYSFEFDNKASMAFASRMSGHDELILEELAVSDFMRLRQEIANIILGVTGASREQPDPSAQPVA